MLREFALTYLRRLAVLLPFIALVVLLPPAPLGAKLAGLATCAAVVLLVQLVEAALVLRNRVPPRDDGSVERGETSRRRRRPGGESTDQLSRAANLIEGRAMGLARREWRARHSSDQW